MSQDEAAQSFRITPPRQWLQWETIAPRPYRIAMGRRKLTAGTKFATIARPLQVHATPLQLAPHRDYAFSPALASDKAIMAQRK
ncbi:hypothetical protein [Sphingopyxis sp. LK2115]|jgi:hypothetical protein|uniref:hypothetical protein n=1 Tax=Sphingopyxis sp. LK2115 TaxID=2744558 RepID=UPI001660DEDE|nr:hypothetical protein [Sphingopyxis sp. LK2115]